MAEYDRASLYIMSRTTLAAKIVAIDAIISALELKALDAAANEDITEYWLDDGQTKIKELYRGTAGIAASILAFDQLKQRYVNKYNGRARRLVPSKNIPNRR